MNVDALMLYIILWLSLGYLIYRYARYSAWTDTLAGKGFMAMKAALWILTTFVLAATLDPDGAWRDWLRPVALGLVQAAVIGQIVIVVKEQGGWRQRPRPRRPKRIERAAREPRPPRPRP